MTRVPGYTLAHAPGRGWPRGPLGSIDRYDPAPAIGFCPRCTANARRTTVVRGVFDCPECTFQWHDPRVGSQTRTFDDFFSGE